MSYFKQLGAGPDKSRFQSESLAVTQQSGAATAQSASFAETKAKWPRCAIGGKQGYLYRFANGASQCTRDWDQRAYSMVVKGESPSNIPDLSSVRPGSSEYFRWLCKAQGDGSDPTIQAIRIGFDRANLTWTPTVDVKSREWGGYPTAPHPQVPANEISACAAYANFGTNNRYWPWRAYEYSVKHGEVKEGKRPGSASAGTQEHRASACDDPANNVPPELREACRAALNKNDGTSVQSFLEQMKHLTTEQMEELIYGGANAGASLPTPPPSGLPPLVLYGGAAAVGVVALLLLKKGKK